MRVLILNQTFYPDVVATAQHATDLALELTALGHQVTVVCGARAYDDPSRRFTSRESWNGIEIYRISNSGLGKSSKWRRAADFASFMASCIPRVLLLPKFDLILAMTSPPLISWLAAQLVPWKAHRLVVWSMDLNPDEAIAAGWLSAGSLSAKFLSAQMTASLRHADRVVALDRFMLDRIAAKGVAPGKIAVVPPWPHEPHVRFDALGREQFRFQHGLQDKFVVMYSGNHSPCHPLDTLLEAATKLGSRDDIVFCFIGGGSEFRKVEARARQTGANNILCLPYQPLSKLAGSLSSADLQVVVMGEPFVGIIHPCKIYNILAVGAPVLYIGPGESHVSDIAASCRLAPWFVNCQHGKVDDVAEAISAMSTASLPKPAYPMPSEFKRDPLIARMIEALRGELAREAHPSRAAAELHT